MRFKSIQVKIALVAGVCLVVTSGILVVYSLFATSASQKYVESNVSALINKSTEAGLLALASKQAGFIASELQVNLDAARTLARAFEALKRDMADGVGEKNVRTVLNDILLNVLKDNPKFLGAYSAWEPDALDGRDSEFRGDQQGGHDATGRFIPYWNRDERGKIARQALVEYESQDKHPNGVRKGGWYLGPRETGKESVLDPFPYIVQGKQDWLTTISVPVVVEGKFLGVAGTDLRLNFLQDLSREVDRNLHDAKGEVMIISNMGLIVAHSEKPELIGQHVKALFPQTWEETLRQVQAGAAVADLGQTTGLVRVFAPITLGRTGKPWSVLIQVSPEVVMAEARALDAALSGRARDNAVWQVGVGSGVTLAAIGLLWLVTGGMVKPLRRAAAFAESVAQGDFTHRLDVSQQDEIGVLANALRAMVDKLQGMIRQAEAKGREAAEEADRARRAMAEAEEAKRRADQAQREGMLQAARKLEGVVTTLTSASTELSEQVERSSKGAEMQNGRAQETASAMQQMNSTVLDVARNASQAAEGSSNAKRKAQDGEEVVRQAVRAISAVQVQATRLKENMSALGEQADGIGQIIDVISDIADQTNLLALNAAIEAARAGDAGRGFAVVADEVRKLAEKTMSATSEVGDSVRAIQNGARLNIENVDSAARAIDQATELANKSGAALQEIVTIAEVSADQVRAIAAASEEQSAASEQINKAIEDINDISQDTSAAMRQSAEAVDELSRQAQTLQDLVRELKNT